MIQGTSKLAEGIIWVSCVLDAIVGPNLSTMRHVPGQYAARYEIYRQLYPALRPIFHSLFAQK